jgi:hypothetical protein
MPPTRDGRLWRETLVTTTDHHKGGRAYRDPELGLAVPTRAGATRYVGWI